MSCKAELHWRGFSIVDGSVQDNVLVFVSTSKSMGCRDYMLNDKDIDNLAKTLDEFEWRFNPDDANSIHIWTQRNPDSIVYYQQQRESEQQIFTLAISDPWQQDQLRKHGHGKAVLLDGTFGNNSKKV